MRFAKAVVKYRIPILILTVILIIPSVIGMIATHVNYDMLTYLPSDIETIIGQDELLKDFDKGAFSFLIFEGMSEKNIVQLKEKVENVSHVDTVLWYDSLFDLSIPMELLPDSIYREFNTDHSTMMAVFFDTGTSDELTINAVEEIRSICGEQCFVSGMTALVVDLRDLCEKEEPIYVGLAVGCACVVMVALLDGWLIPFVFLASIGVMILFNLGTNIIFGEISYITKALSAVLQLAVTMDYSIFLWHSYNEKREKNADRFEAMAVAIKETLTSVIGSSVTTIAGFAALCFMSFTLGKDLGIVMAKGVFFGVVGCVTVLPSLILVLDRPLQKTKHRSLIPNNGRLARSAVEENRSLITEKVTDAVREQVKIQVTAVAQEQVSSKVIPLFRKLVMSSAKIKREIQTNTDEQMLTEDVQKIISDNVELQIEQIIQENMESEAVQSQLTAASEGFSSLISLKSSLDSYNEFYLGLQAYTDGVAAAAEGADKLARGSAELENGAKQIYDGLERIYEEAIQRLINFTDVNNNSITARLKAMISVSEAHGSFAGTGDDMNGQVFIYRTDEIFYIDKR